jgi:hypothetical protein
MSLDTFDNPAEEQPTDGLDTFDNDVYPSDNESFDEEVAAKGEDQQETKNEVDPNSQVNNLDEKEDEGEKSEKSESDDEKSPDKGAEEDKQAKEESENESKDASDVSKDDGSSSKKLVKGIAGDKQVKIPEDTTFRVRIDGKAHRVPIQELINNYSGQVAYNEKFEALASERKEFDTRFQEYEQERQEIIQDIKGVTDRVRGVFEGKNKPLDAVEFMLDSMGVDSFKYKKEAFNQMAEEFIEYAQMDEVERDNYWLRQEKEYLQKAKENLASQTEAERNREESQRHIAQLRQAHGINEEQYAEAEADIRELGQETSPEQIVRYAAMKPFTLEAENLVEQYSDQMSDDEYDDVVIKISRELFSGDLDSESVARILEETYALDDYIDEANSKVIKDDAPIVSRSGKEANKIESFDDYEDEYFDY